MNKSVVSRRESCFSANLRHSTDLASRVFAFQGILVDRSQLTVSSRTTTFGKGKESLKLIGHSKRKGKQHCTHLSSRANDTNRHMSASSPSPPPANQKRCSSCAKVKAIEEFSGKKFTRVVNLDLLIYASGQVVQPAIPAVSTNVASAQQKCLITDRL